MPIGQPMDHRAPKREIAAVTRREFDQAQALNDSRFGDDLPTEARVKFIGPDQPPRKRGRMWLEPKPPGGWPDA